MTEDVLHYIWKTQSFNKAHLMSVAGEPLEILRQGTLNTDSGPDFSNGRVSIAKVDWIGDIEIHTKSSYWNTHNHQQDKAYNKVILHVVWQDDYPVLREDGSKIPTLELESLVDHSWLAKYESLQGSLDAIPCTTTFHMVENVHKVDAINKALVERLQRKSKRVLQYVTVQKGDWEIVTMHLLFQYFGFKKNNEAFLQLETLVDFRIVRKISSIEQMEAYLFGLAGFLGSAKTGNTYQKLLLEEYEWLKKKFKIKAAPMAITWWKFMRMRPANFPTLRIAQLSALLVQKKHLFQSLIQASPTEANNFFKVEVAEFWQRNYHFNKLSKSGQKEIGEQSIQILNINVAAVLLVAYATYTNNEWYIEKALNYLEKQKPENNYITRGWNEVGMKITSAAESQGAIELFNNYCKNRRCLDCNIGNQLLQS